METTRDTLKSDVQRLIACFFALLAQPREKLGVFARAVRALEDRVRRWILSLAVVRDGLCTEEMATGAVTPQDTQDETEAPREPGKRQYAPRRSRAPQVMAEYKDAIGLADLAHWLARLRTLANMLDNPDAALAFVRPHLMPSNPYDAPSYAPKAQASLIAATEALLASFSMPTRSAPLAGRIAPQPPAPDSS